MQLLNTRPIERALWAVGLACAGYLMFLAAQAQILRERSSVAPSAARSASREPGALIGRVDIPALHLSVAVLEDDQSQSLLRGLGHIPGTAQIGGLGTVGLAGHRDTFLRPLRKISPGMEIVASDGTSAYRYLVDSTEIVRPEMVSVVATHSRPELTLITCYPFDYFGHAPGRFIVHAHLISAAPE